MVVDRYMYRGGVEEQISRYQIRISIDPTGVEKLSRRQKHSRSIQQVSRSYRGGRSILDRSTKCRGGVEQAFKTNFSRCEKHRHECNPTCNSTNDPINILSSQNHLSIKILSTWILKKTHTH